LLIKQLGIRYHYDALSKGLIDSRDVLYFFCVGAFMLLVTKIILSARSW
jgi:ABC-2 type transport system permease protein